MNCDLCGAENLEGVDACDACGADLTADDLERRQVGQGRLQAAVLGRLQDVERYEPLVLGPEDTVAAAVALMRKERHGSVVLVEEGRPVGIFTEHDLITRLAPDADLAAVPLAVVMTADPHCNHLEHSVARVLHAQAVESRRHVPIVDDDGTLHGFVSVRGILKHIRDRAGL